MFGRKSTGAVSSSRSANSSRNENKKSLSQFGLIDIPDFDDDDAEDMDDDDDLEAELLALTKGSAPKPKRKLPPVINASELDKIVKASLYSIPSDDEEVSSGEDDPTILAELEELQVDSMDTGKETKVRSVSASSSNSMKALLMERLRLYESGEQNAKNANDSSKARRMSRGIATLKSLIKQADAGGAINEDDIPPLVSVTVTKPVAPVTIPMPSEPSASTEIAQPTEQTIEPSPPPIPPRTIKHPVPPSAGTIGEPELKSKPQQQAAPKPRQPTKEFSVLEILKQRQSEYKTAALEAKRANELATALSHIKIVKQFDVMISALNEGSTVDVSSIPPPPSKLNSTQSTSVQPPAERQKSQDRTQKSASPPESPLAPAPAPEYVPPKNTLEALQQRLQKFQESEEAAKKEENASKVRRLGRVVKQYQDAIRLYKLGKPVPVDELPTPPGFAPIPVEGASTPGPSPAAPAPPQETPNKHPKPTAPRDTTAQSPQNRSAGSVTRNEKQMQTILERQKLFKVAALNAKQSGDMELAKEYLRLAKGFDSLIEACKCGLPVDLNTIPVPPNEKKTLESSYEVVRLNDCIEGSVLDVYQKLQLDLQQQLELCMKTRDHFKAMGDVANANRFEQLAVQTRKDLKFVQLANSSNLRVPNFHYETKPFTIVQCNVELMDNDVEVCIVQGINYNVPNPKEVDTYVKVTFPYPSEAPQQYKTAVVYNTNNPSYNSQTTFSMQRNARACKRIFVRNSLKCEVWSKGGFLRSDTLIGTVNVKLQPLETQCTLHNAYDLMDGRKTVGGKLEVKIRIRDPIAQKQVEHVEEKWLIIDS